VCHVQRVCNLRPEIHQLLDRNWLPLDAILQRAAFEVLHHNVVTVLVLADVVNSANIGMVKSRCRPGLTTETLQSLGVFGHFIWQELQGNEAVKASVFGLVDNAHAAATKLLDNAIVRNRLVDH
jgi:hypothetical protein